MAKSSRPYRQVARAAAAEELRERIIVTFEEAFLTGWMEDITLDRVAQKAGTTRQTVFRLFGGKEGLLNEVAMRLEAEIATRRAVSPGADPRAAVRALVSDYEITGDLTIRNLAQEERWPVLKGYLNVGRRFHRRWVSETFGPLIGTPDALVRGRRIDQLIIATDVYTWKLLRRDFRHTVERTETVMTGMIQQFLREGGGDR